MIAYEKFGSGEKHLILLHAFPFDGRMWMQQIIALKDEFTLIVPDMRGFGKSSEMELYISSMDSFAGDVLEVANHAGLNKFSLCGLSMGGYLIFKCWQLFKSRIEKIILADTRAENDTAAGLADRASTLIRLQMGEKESIAQELLLKLISNKTITYNVQAADNALAMMQDQTTEAFICGTVAIAMRMNAVDVLKTIQVPTCIIVGSEDVLTPLSFSQNMHQQITGSELHVIEHAGHLSNLEQPEKFNEIIRKFLSE